MASPQSENAVKKLARLPGNIICPNCGTTKKFGFGTVCIKFGTFVCNDCKSAHQSFSHRCKSLTMSTWTAADVLLLKTHGNDVARATWLGKAPPIGQGGRPKPGDSLETVKLFVRKAYEHKEFYNENGSANANANAAAAPQASMAPVRRRQPVAQAAPPQQPRAAAAPAAPPPVADLLDFGAFDAAPAITSTPAAPNVFGDFSTAPAPATEGGFADFSASAAPPLAAPPTASNDFASFSSAPSSNSHADPFGATPVAPAPSVPVMGGSNMANNNATFDPFNAMASSSSASASTNTGLSQLSQQQTTPAMNNGMMSSPMGGSSSGATIGMMSNGMGSMMNNGGGGMTMMNGAGGGMMSNGGMMNGNGMASQQQQQMMMMMQQQQRMMMMQHQQQPPGAFGGGMGIMGGQPASSMQPSPSFSGVSPGSSRSAMSMNIMQPMSNSISSNFGGASSSTAATGHGSSSSAPQNDPFANLGL